jgi:GNAT superfamily N-acetyltransferase
MTNNDWSEDRTRYDLAAGFRLERADPRTFAAHQVLYQGPSPIFLYDWDRAVAMVAENDFLADKLFWILDEGYRVGGTIMWPNTMSGLYLEPPFVDLSLVLRALIPLMHAWSDGEAEITAASVLPEQREHFERAGFRLNSVARCMARTTEAFEISWNEGLRLTTPGEEDEERLIELAHLAHSERGFSPQSLEHRQAMVGRFLGKSQEDEVTHQASTLLYDEGNGPLIGACLISLWEGWPLVYDLVVHPAHQRKGLARRLLQHALTALHPTYPVLRLFVGVGNPAESLYYRMGFVPGRALASLKLHH